MDRGARQVAVLRVSQSQTQLKQPNAKHGSVQTKVIEVSPHFEFKMVYLLNAKVSQSCPILRDSMDCSLSGSSVHGIFQARILEWVAMPSSRGSFRPRDRTHLLR